MVVSFLSVKIGFNLLGQHRMGHQLSTYVSNLPCVPICPYIKTPRLGTTGVRVTTNSVRHVHCPQSDSPMDQKYNFWQIVEVSILIRGLLHRNTTSIKAPFMKLLVQWSMCVFLPPRKNFLYYQGRNLEKGHTVGGPSFKGTVRHTVGAKYTRLLQVIPEILFKNLLCSTIPLDLHPLCVWWSRKSVDHKLNCCIR